MYKVEIVNDGGYGFVARAKDYEFKVDLRGNGVTPPDALLASLGSCIGVYLRKYSDSAKLSLGNFKVSVHAEFTRDQPMRFQEIKVAVDLCGAGLDERRKSALLDFVKNCPVHNTLEGRPAVQIRKLRGRFLLSAPVGAQQVAIVCS